MPLGLIALALGGFGIGLTEFVIAGLLSNVATDLEVTIPVAGYLVSGYAFAVVIGALFLTPLANKLRPKRALLWLMVLFVVGNLLCALAPSYGVMMTGRVIAALTHGAFFGIGAVLASSLVAPEKKASAIAIMFGGLTTANVLGVPFGTVLGQNFGWRAAFWAISVVGVAAFMGVLTLVPDSPENSAPASIRAQLIVFTRPQVLFSLLITILVFGGMFGAFIYIEPLLTQVTGFSAGAIPWLLVGFGLGMFAGNIVGGRYADRALAKTLTVLTVALIATMAAFALTAHNQVAATVFLVLMGFFGFATSPGLQMRALAYAGDAPTMASAANIAAFNLGNGLGVYFGGLTIAAGFGFISPLWVGVALTTTGLVVLLLASWRAGVTRPAEAALQPA